MTATDAKKFREQWIHAKGSEKSETQQFWNGLLAMLAGDKPAPAIEYELPVKAGATTLFLDAWIPKTRVLVEQKSRNIDLAAPQHSHDGKNAFEQAVEYDNARPYHDRARWIVTCNFDEFLIYDRARPLDDPQRVLLADLPKELGRLAFLVDSSVDKVDDRELLVSIQACNSVARLYDAFLARCTDPSSPATLAALNRLCVRLVFCFYAEDAPGLFAKDAFLKFLRKTPAESLRRMLIALFKTLDTPEAARDGYLEDSLKTFPYVNGGLFSGADESEIPRLDEEIRDLLIRASKDFDWSGISPVIFGSLFESTLNPETRRKGGMHYTSIENIHKVIDPLFLNGLAKKVDRLTLVRKGADKIASAPLRLGIKKTELLALQNELASLTFLDPACGSGNFLTETYLSLRRLENRIIAAMQSNGQMEFDLGNAIKVSIAQFHGIEINDFAVNVARTALWIAEAQMKRETETILQREMDFLPLRSNANIREGNALRMDWSRLGSEDEGIPALNGARFRAAKAHLHELKKRCTEVANPAGERFRFVRPVLDMLKCTKRMTAPRRIYLAAIGAIEKLCAASFLAGMELPRRKTCDVDFYTIHLAGFTLDGKGYVARIVSKRYPVSSVNAPCAVSVMPLKKSAFRGMATAADIHLKDKRLDPESKASIAKLAGKVKRACARTSFDYIMGNPPFVGAMMMKGEKRDDLLGVFPECKMPGEVDYVAGWYAKAIKHIRGTGARCAFVSTNSICQGQQTSLVWKPLVEKYGLEIDFAWRTFRWDSESTDKAHVHCVIVGFHTTSCGGYCGDAGSTSRDRYCGDAGVSPAVSRAERGLQDTNLLWSPAAGETPAPPQHTAPPQEAKTIFTPAPVRAAHINAYLMDAPDVWIEPRTTPLSPVPPMVFGNMPRDGGGFILSEEEKRALEQKEPLARQWIHPYLGAEEFINGKMRYCLWLEGASPGDLFKCPAVMKRVAAVREMRAASKATSTRKMAETPTLFAQRTQPPGHPFILVPRVSSERRQYVPMGFIDPSVVASDSSLVIPAAGLYHFGVLTSSVHMAWMRATAGRLKSDYRYSAQIVYNNFP
ncbi:MAG: hypothetical protein IJ802_02530, partial [Kiritimatiellae bacterium]|nr:hypothetical protein [Kiritimatiellia bacterium]